MYDDEAPSLFDPAKDVAAIFVDFENMRLTVEESGDEPFQVNKVLDYVDQNIARVAVKKAYSNWHYVNPHMYNLLGNNVDLVQIYTSGAQRKNAADIRLTADAIETLFMFPHVTTYVIVASDSDYTGLILNLRKHGKKVVGVGTRQHTSEHLVRACNLFRFYRTIAADDPHSLRAAVGEMDMQEARDLLYRAMLRHRFADRPAVGRWLRWQMIQLAPSFDEADLGFGNFREFLEACTNVVKVTFDERYQELKIELKDTAQPPVPREEQPVAQAEPRRESTAADAPNPRPMVTITSRPPLAAYGTGSYHGFSDYHYDVTQTFPTRPEDVKRGDYLRTLWEPRIYLYNREVSLPIISEIFRINRPGNPLSQYELEEFLLGGAVESLAGDALGAQRYDLTQKTIYAIQKLMFWAGVIRFLEDDEHVYWKKRKREIRADFKDARQVLETIDLALARHFAKHLPAIPEILCTIFQGDDSLEYAKRIVARASTADAPPPERPEPPAG
jgi:uncharacterized LabA/DUF88 family protein